jgi:CubicO group peptidase (beta-lactamase class C family)
MRFVFLLFMVFGLSSCYMLRAYKMRKLRLEDNNKVPTVSIAKASVPFYYTHAAEQPANKGLAAYLDTNLAKSYTAAFLVIRNDSILYERYFNGFNGQSLLPSFSVAKSFVGTLIGVALQEGIIKSTTESITNYLPELAKRDTRFSKITIQNLLDMRSGVQFNEGKYNIKDDAIKLGFRPNVVKYALKLNVQEEPGKTFRYQSVNTELLALIIERASGKKVSAYLAEKLWGPLGAEQGATWSVDSKKRMQEIAFAGLNATARDFAKLGTLYLNKGAWQGKQLIGKDWVEMVADRDRLYKSGGYKNQWWSKNLSRSFPDSALAVAYKNGSHYTGAVRKQGTGYRVSYQTTAFSAQGLLNQVIYINPKNNVVIVRLGHNWYHPTMYVDAFIYSLGERL